MQEQLDQTPEEEEVTLAISPEKVYCIIVKAGEFDAKEEVPEPDLGSDPFDDQDIAVLEGHEDDPVVQELTDLQSVPVWICG